MKTKNQILLEEFNKAFARSDTDYILGQVTDDIRWTIVGDQTVQNKKAFAKKMNEMTSDEPLELTIHHIITHGKAASVNGTMKLPGSNTAYAFCDVYSFSGFKNPKIREMTSYVVEVQVA